jgi:hypothetical protein
MGKMNESGRKKAAIFAQIFLKKIKKGLDRPIDLCYNTNR